MNRREFLKSSVVVGLSTYITPAWPAPQSRPNLLIIHTDEHNFRTLGCYRKLMSIDQAQIWGAKAIVETPHIDWIAENGATCTKFYATTPVCSPSRAAFTTGRYPQNTPVVTNDIPMNSDVVTFAELLRRQGYATGYAGKWHLDGAGRPQWEPQRRFGFEDNRYMFNRGHWKQLEITDSGPRVVTRNAKGVPNYNIEGATRENFTTDWLTDRAIEFIQTNKGRPFCYMVSIPDPHGPNSVRAPYDTMYDDIEVQLPRTASKTDEGLPAWATKTRQPITKKMLSQYFGMVKCIDDNVGRMLDTLRQEKLIDKTIVIFTSDHGDLCGEHARHNKGVPLEASAKVPFLIVCPGKVQPGKVIGQAMSCVDFLPTILALMGVPTAGQEEGRDCSGLFTGQAPVDWKDVIFIRGTGVRPGAKSGNDEDGEETGGKNDDNWIAAITGRYKLVLQRGEQPWLYDLKSDPDELKNYIDDPACQSVVAMLARELIAYGKKYHDSRVERLDILKKLTNRG